MKKPILLSGFIALILTIFSHPLFATHNRGAEITYRHIGAPCSLEYEITITTYTKTSSCGPACRPTLDSVHLGDGTIMQFVRNSEVFLLDDITVNQYMETYTYPGSGTYTIYFVDPNWDASICNITNSVGVPFCTESMLIINANCCPNNSVTFGDIPILNGEPTKNFIHNVIAIDPDHDSISFELVSPCQATGFSFPVGLSINPISGQINWPLNSISICQYALAVQVKEWRKSAFIGSVTRTFSVIVEPTADTLYNFTPPNLSVDSTGDYYKIVNPGDTVSFKIKYFDNDSAATLTAYSEALLTSDTPNIQITNGGNTDSATVTWIPDATHSRAYPWAFVFRGTSGVRQLDLTVLIYVNGTQIDSCYALNNVSELNDKKTSLKIFPNPSSSEIVIDTSPFYQDEDITLTIYNIFAEIVKVEKRNEYGKNFSIDIKCFPAGLYMARIENKFGQSIGKFVKN